MQVCTFNTKVDDFLSEFQFDKRIHLNPSYPIFLNWINSTQLSSKLKKSAKTLDSKVALEIKKIEKRLSHLKSTKLWLKSNDSIISMTAYDMYNSFLQYLKNGSFENELFNCHELSFVSPAGPFKSYTLIECLHSETLETFLSLNVLQNKMAQRNFRLSVEGKAIVHFGEFHQNSVEVSVEQITESGILFSVDDDFFTESVDFEYLLKFQLTSEHLKNYFQQTDKEVRDPFYTKNNFEFFQIDQRKVMKSLKYDSSSTGKVYMFCRYNHMLGSNLPTEFKDFIEQFKNFIK